MVSHVFGYEKQRRDENRVPLLDRIVASCNTSNGLSMPDRGGQTFRAGQRLHKARLASQEEKRRDMCEGCGVDQDWEGRCILWVDLICVRSSNIQDGLHLQGTILIPSPTLRPQIVPLRHGIQSGDCVYLAQALEVCRWASEDEAQGMREKKENMLVDLFDRTWL
ncbi:hypothetical protein GB937_001302 [Aspergillus fischeri]|nr:hypothetical protein GB937_001302 [Aspergillus fischeri]